MSLQMFVDTLEERPIYEPLRRPCDDPEKIFAANRGKWREEPPKPKASVDNTFHAHCTKADA